MGELLITKGNQSKRGEKKKTLAERVVLGTNTLVILLIFLICTVSISYLVHSNRSAAKGYILKELKEDEKKLMQDANYWSLKLSKLTSLKRLERSSIASQMHGMTSDIVYIQEDTTVALKR